LLWPNDQFVVFITYVSWAFYPLINWGYLFKYILLVLPLSWRGKSNTKNYLQGKKNFKYFDQMQGVQIFFVLKGTFCEFIL
jgi:hypothetical protein